MARVALLGASGFTGRLVLGELLRRGHAVVAGSRDQARLRESTSGLDGEVEPRQADVTNPDSIDAAIADADVVLTTAGPFQRLGPPVVEAALRTRRPYVDVAAEQPFVRWVLDRDADASTADVSMVTGAGLVFAVGDALADIAAAALPGADTLHVTYIVRARGLAPPLSAGSRRTAAAMLGGPTGVCLLDGEVVEEGLGEARRLAWFPRPLGPSHAAGIPSGEALTVPGHVAGIRTVRTYLSVPGWQAELLQFAGAAARWRWFRSLATSILQAPLRDPSGSTRQATRWACVAEAARPGDREVARAWASGTDVYGVSAVSAVAIAEAVAAGGTPPGVLPPSVALGPRQLLDRLAERADLLWSVTHPST